MRNINPFIQKDLAGNVIRCKFHNYKLVSSKKKICVVCGFISFVIKDNIKKKN